MDLFEWFGDVNIGQNRDQEELSDESAMNGLRYIYQMKTDDERSGVQIERSDELEMKLRIGDVIKCQREDTKVAKTIDEHVEGAKSRFRLENNKMKMRKGTNYGSLSGYHCDVKREWDRSGTPKGQKPCLGTQC